MWHVKCEIQKKETQPIKEERNRGHGDLSPAQLKVQNDNETVRHSFSTLNVCIERLPGGRLLRCSKSETGNSGGLGIAAAEHSIADESTAFEDAPMKVAY